ncbi:MAG TPA: SDR family NAD(P)-dependent oxidoreductase [Enteractinococcus sp.]
MPTFDAQSTTDDILGEADLSGTRVLITGTSAGLGVETARSLSVRGAQVTGVVRDVEKARANLDEAGAQGVELFEADLASLASVRKFTDAFQATGQQIDVLIANAGIMACPQATTEDGFELQFGTNHLGHFVLVNRLVPQLATDGRVVILSSAAHRHSDVNLDDPNFEHTQYEEWKAYGRSKTANALFALELDRRLQDRNIRAASVHPGVIETELMRHLTPETSQRSGARKMQRKTVGQGAATTIWAGFSADADHVGGKYCEDCAVSPVTDDPRQRPGVMRYATDAEAARELWSLSEEMVGETFNL